MKGTRIVSAGGLLGIAGLMALPMSAGAASAPSGFAKSSALQLEVSPMALLSVNTGVSALNSLLQQVQAGVSQALGDTKLTLQIDAANANGQLTQDLQDVAAAHADSMALNLKFHPLDTVLSQLQAVLQPLGAVDPTVLSALQSVNPQAAAALQQVVSALGTGNLGAALQALGINVGADIAADLANGAASPAATKGVNTKRLVDLNLGSVPGLQLDLAPFNAIAQDNALSGGAAQAHADNTTTNLAVAPTLALPVSGINLPSIQAALDGLLSKIQAALASVSGLPAAPATGTPADQLLGQLKSLTGSTSGAATTSITDALRNAGLGAVADLIGTGGAPSLSALVSKIQAVLDNLNILNAVNSGLSLNQLVATNGVTSSSTFSPVAGGVEAKATSLVNDVSVLPLAPQLASVLGVNAGTALIHLHGISSLATATLGQNPGTSSDSHLASIDVLGQTVVSGADVQNVLDKGTALTKAIPGTPLTLIVTYGAPQNIAHSATEQHEAITALDVRLVTNSGSAGVLPNVSGPRMNAASAMASPDGTVVDLSLANSEADVTTLAGSPPGGCSSDCTLPKTGMFGTGAFGLAGGLAAVAVLLQLVPRALQRRRAVR